MPNTKDLLTAFRQHLVDREIVRKASQAAPAGKPPMFVELAEGAPAPNEREGVENDPELMVSLFVGGDIPPPPYMGFLHEATIDVRYRAAPNRAQRAIDLDDEIRREVIGWGTGSDGARYDWVMAGLSVVESRVWSGLTRLGANPAQGYDFRSSFYFQIRA